MASPLRQKLLDQTQKGNRRLIVTVGEGDDAFQVEVRTPSLAESLKFASVKEGDVVEQYRGMVQASVVCSFDPETGEKIFDPTDVDVLMDQPSTAATLEPIIKALGELISDAQKSSKN